MTIPFSRLHVINHPTYLEHIQKHNSKNYIRGAFTRSRFGQLHRTGIFVADGKEWQVQRKAATRAFSKKNFETHITGSLHHWLDILVRLFSNLAKEGRPFDFQALMARLMFCLFLRIAFHEDELALDILSEDPKSLESIPPYVEAFDRALHCASPFPHMIINQSETCAQYLTDEDVTRCGDSRRSYLERTRFRRKL